MGSVATPQDEDRGTGLGALLRLHVELWLVVVMMALAFGAGIVVTALYEEPQDQAVVSTQLPSGQFVAPPLSDDQISQGLPSGHPDISGETGAKGQDPKGEGEGDAAQGAEPSEGTG